MKLKISKESIILDIHQLGVRKGDVLFIAADLLHVGYYNKSREQTLRDWVELLIEAVGPSGTIVIPAYTGYFFRWKKNPKVIFTRKTLPEAGSLSLGFYKYADCQRSTHPTNSCFAIGMNSEYILNGHHENSSSYLPYHRLVELRAKHLMLGGFSDGHLSSMAIHSAQEYLNVTNKNWCSGLIQAYYIDQNGNKKLFTRRGVGGCTSGGFKAIGHHVINNAIKFGKVGRGTSVLIDCKKSHDIYVDLLKNSPGFTKCDNRLCPDCYGSPIYLHPYFWVKKIMVRLWRHWSLQGRSWGI